MHPIRTVFSVMTCVALMTTVLIAADSYEGKVLKAGDGKITFKDKSNEEKTFDVSEKAKITRNGKDATLDDIEDGDSVQITASKKNEKFIATAITATAAE